MHFVANLRQETINIFGQQATQPAAYLLSAHRVTPASLEAAATIRALNIPLFADNGTKPLIENTIQTFEERANEIQLAVRALRRQLGHVPRGRDVPPELRAKASKLATDVVQHATRLSDAIDPAALIVTQLAMRPTDLIAQEDFATGCLIGLSLERETTGWTVSDFDRRNRRSLRLWRRVADDPRCADLRVYAVLSAMDYNTARSAGRLAASAGVTHASIGIAGITLDASVTDFMVFGSASLTLDKPVPRRYVRLAQILCGIADGYTDAGKAMTRFHCLGLGTTAMLPVAARALSETTLVTEDATSPIHDAVRDRVLYDPEKDGDRVTTRQIVERIVNGGDWAFVSPFTRAFRDEFGHDPGKARTAWEVLGRPLVTEHLLETPSELTDALPLFADADADIQAIASRTRIAHNHWVLGNISETFPDQIGRHALALAAIDRLIAETPTVTTRALAVARQVLTRERSR